MKIEIRTSSDCIDIYVDGEHFGGFSNEAIQDYPEDLTLYREMKFLLKLPQLFRDIRSAKNFKIAVYSTTESTDWYEDLKEIELEKDRQELALREELAALRAWKEKARPYLVEMKIKKLGDLIRATENARNESETSAFKICMEANKSQLIREYEELKQLLEEE